ncbi:MAG: monovalent cation/H+ antiporter complex subunit F [Firmicutes bacterium]|nr:monovalent cation/H+ antiporter complex subunit F [Bacillota bacterium]
MMEKFFLCFLIGIIILTLLMLYQLFRGPGIFDRFIGILVMATNVILILIVIGFVDGRRDMYVDVAISYGILGFISSVILAKFIGQRGGKKNGR